MIIQSSDFASIELARQAAIQAAEQEDAREGIDCMGYQVRTGQGVDRIHGQYYSQTADDWVWLSTGIEII